LGLGCLPSCWFDMAGTGRERARSGGRRAGTTAVSFFLSCCAMPRCFRPSLSPIAEGWIHWEKEARLGAWVWPTATGSRRCPKSKARRRRPGSGSQWASASPPTDRGRWPVASQLSLLSLGGLVYTPQPRDAVCTVLLCWKTCMVIVSTKSYLFFLSRDYQPSREMSPSSAVPSKLASCSADSNRGLISS
jgi:hypothetical protein